MIPLDLQNPGSLGPGLLKLHSFQKKQILTKNNGKLYLEINQSTFLKLKIKDIKRQLITDSANMQH